MNYIKEYDNVLDNNFCDELIVFFYKSDKLKPGVTFSGFQKDVKNTTDFHFNSENNNEFIKYADEILFKTTNKYIQEYLNEISVLDDNREFNDKGYQMQCYKKNNGYYKYHHDQHINILESEYRVLTYLYYLNDVEEGGETEFCGKIKISPKKGKLVIFPASILFPHCGLMPISNDKYIITGWLYSTI
jgi:Rps23 Pro-64 3,4-dihydroxylase Tpa1-like proline 4-hydroxylase